MMDEVGFARAMREVQEHRAYVQDLADELLRRVRHPSLAAHPQALFLRAIGGDIHHHAFRLAEAAHSLYEAADRRRKP